MMPFYLSWQGTRAMPFRLLDPGMFQIAIDNHLRFKLYEGGVCPEKIFKIEGGWQVFEIIAFDGFDR